MATSLVTDSRGTRVVTGLVPALYDRVDVTYPDTVTEVYAYSYTGNPCGTVTLVYTTAAKEFLLSAERTA